MVAKKTSKQARKTTKATPKKTAKKAQARSTTPKVHPDRHLYAGTYLTSKQLLNREVLTESFAEKPAYRWSAGTAVSRFLLGFKDGRIVGIECPNCERVVTPPRDFCEVCMAPITRYVDLPTTGTINTYTICYIDTAAVRVKDPTFPVVVDIDGTEPRVGFMHLMGEVKAKRADGRMYMIDKQGREVRIGDPIEAVFKPKGQRKADITDIKYFRPVGGS